MITSASGQGPKGRVRFNLNHKEEGYFSGGPDGSGNDIVVRLQNRKAIGVIWAVESGRPEITLKREGFADKDILIGRGLLVGKLVGDKEGSDGEVDKEIIFKNPASPEYSLKISVRREAK